LKIYTPKDFPLNFPTVITIGSFDGIHIGHKTLFKETINLSKKLNVTPVIVSFDPHPRLILFPEANFKLLTTLEEKIYLLSKQEIKNLVLIPFSLNVAQLSADLFVQEYIVDDLKAKAIVVGFNFRFGRNRKGDTAYLEKLGEKYNFVVKTVSPVVIDDLTVSSTVIRQLITRGEIEKANQLLGHPYFMIGKVVKGKGRGKNLGFPTANLEFPSSKLIPAPGVYAVWVYFKGKKFKGAMNIGTKPTFEDKELTVEVHIFDFKEEIYGETLEVEIIKRIREEKRFSSLEALKEQIQKDCILISQILS
jgi:riboflavin kinase/FMN adenylyltransferase